MEKIRELSVGITDDTDIEAHLIGGQPVLTLDGWAYVSGSRSAMLRLAAVARQAADLPQPVPVAA